MKKGLAKPDSASDNSGYYGLSGLFSGQVQVQTCTTVINDLHTASPSTKDKRDGRRLKTDNLSCMLTRLRGGDNLEFVKGVQVRLRGGGTNTRIAIAELAGR